MPYVLATVLDPQVGVATARANVPVCKNRAGPAAQPQNDNDASTTSWAIVKSEDPAPTSIFPWTLTLLKRALPVATNDVANWTEQANNRLPLSEKSQLLADSLQPTNRPSA